MGIGFFFCWIQLGPRTAFRCVDRFNNEMRKKNILNKNITYFLKIKVTAGIKNTVYIEL